MTTLSVDSVSSTDSAFEYDHMRMSGKSFEVTDREGQSALVPGVTATKPPIESTSKPFTNYKSPRIETEVEVPKSTRTTSSAVAKGYISDSYIYNGDSSCFCGFDKPHTVI